MPASAFVHALNGIQRALRPTLKAQGFNVRGRTFNRVTDDGLTQVVNLQMGAFDPPGTTYVSGVGNMHGLFTVNLGVYIPEVAEVRGGGPSKAWVQEYHCAIRSRLGRASDSDRDIWWHARNATDVLAGVQPLLLSYGLAFLDRFRSRDSILAALEGEGENLAHCAVPRVVSAIILAKRGEVDTARSLMTAQAMAASANPGHAAHVRELAERLGLGAV